MARMRVGAFKHREPDADERGGASDYDKDEPGKRTKESVNYSKGNEKEHCGICKHFQPPWACEKVSGHIVPAYWCRLFTKAGIKPVTKHLRRVNYGPNISALMKKK